MYDSKHRFMQISTVPEESTTFRQKGVREYLLCEKCEEQFSIYERYVSQKFYHQESITVKQDDKAFIAENVDYSLMKLFQLSLLWRASVSQLEIFGDVKLGPHEEYLRNMLTNENPGEDYEYGCLQFAIFMEKNKLADGLILAPAFFRVDGFRHYRFIFGGLIWLYVISSHNNMYRWKEFFLLKTGKLTIHKKMIDDIKFIMDFGIDLKKQGKLNNAN